MSEKDIIKEYGNVILDAEHIINDPPRTISVSPKIDIALGGGVPEGSLFILTGREKVGKTVTALHFCKNAQKLTKPDGKPRKIYYGNIEGRLKRRDLLGIKGLDLDNFRVISSVEGNILSGEKYLGIFDQIIHNEPYAVGVIDSFSALIAESELVGDITDMQVAVMNRYLAKFTRKFANVLPINRVTLVGITHLMANIQKFGVGKSTVEKSGNAIKYAQDVKLYATHTTPILEGSNQIGQKVHWIVENSAIGPPGQKVTSYIRYGYGIWETMELAELAVDFGIIKKSGSWFKLPNGEQSHGLPKLCQYLEENPNAYSDTKQAVYELLAL